MDYIRGLTRNQVMLFPESVEDYITEDNPVRFIDAFVTSLDLVELGRLKKERAALVSQATEIAFKLFGCVAVGC